jgi:predicted nucleic acid-binding protein
MNAVDTNVFLYLLDADDPAKQVKAVNLLDRLMLKSIDTLLIWQVAGEFLSQLCRWEALGRLSANERKSAFNNVRAMFVLQLPTGAVLDLAIEMRSRFNLSHWDSMLLAACKEANVETLYSEDMDSNTDYDRLVIVNPFK